ncbi:MAG: SIS domain-containing protein, partial [bacterium]
KEFIELLGLIRVSDKEGNRLALFYGIELACKIIKERKDNKIFFIGNGGSAAIASHMAIDFWKNGGIKAFAFNDSSLLTCISNDVGYKYVFEKPLLMFANKNDILFAISSSGKSENIIRGVDAALNKGCSVITLSGFDENNPLSSMGNINFYVPKDRYGPVETIHQYLCHYILDIILYERE